MALPVAGIVCIVLACWVVLVLALFCLYRILKHRGSCDCECAPCGTEGGESCPCCKAVSDSCNCCNPSLNGCLNSVCPKKKISCVDIILCQCCAEPGQDSCLVNIFPCCTKDCECCEDGCCTCCADCDALICCCLEIRLISKSVPGENSSPAAKYTPNYSKNELLTNRLNLNTSSKENETLSKTVNFTNIEKQETKSSSKSFPGTRKNKGIPRAPDSVTSDTRVQLEYNKSNAKQHLRGKPAIKMKSQSGISKKSQTKSDTASTRSLPWPPSLPPKMKSYERNKLKSGARKRTNSESSASDLKEVPVEQKSALLHSHLYKSTCSVASESLHGGPEWTLGLPHYDASSQAVLLDSSAINRYSFSSLPQMSPGTILDGSGTHRSSSACSTFSVHLEDVNSLASPRPLPGLPGR